MCPPSPVGVHMEDKALDRPPGPRRRGQTGTPEPRLPPARDLPALAAAAWGLLFAVPHMLWGFGLFEDALRFSLGTKPGAAEDRLIGSPWFSAFGLWGVAVLCLLASAIALSTIQSWGERLPHWLPIAGAWAVAVILAIRGLVFPGLLGSAFHELGDRRFSGDTDPDWMRWNLVLWSPWFLLGAMLFAFAATQRQRNRHET